MVLAWVLKEMAEEISPLLTVILQKSLDSDTVPVDWRSVNVIAMFRKGTASKPATTALCHLQVCAAKSRITSLQVTS